VFQAEGRGEVCDLQAEVLTAKITVVCDSYPGADCRKLIQYGANSSMQTNGTIGLIALGKSYVGTEGIPGFRRIQVS